MCSIFVGSICHATFHHLTRYYLGNPRDHPRSFDQVGHQTTYASIGNKHFSLDYYLVSKVIMEKSRDEGSLMEQDTIENVSQPKFFPKLFKKKKIFLTSFYAEYVFTVYNVFKKNFLPMKT